MSNYKLDEFKIDYPVINLDDKTKEKIIELQGIIEKKKNNKLSPKQLIYFIMSAMNYGEFQIWLIDCTLNGIKLTYEEQIKKFLEVTSVEEILTIYDIEYDYDNNLIKKDVLIDEFAENGFIENYCLSEEEKIQAKRLRLERKHN